MVCRVWVAVFVLALLVPAGARAQEDEIADFEELDLEELLDVVFSASKHEQSIFWSPSAITIFTREDIRSSGADSLVDLLRRVPGFDVYEMKFSFPLVGARALTDISSNLVLVLVDGREALVEMAGWPLWAAMTIDLEEVERIEVIRGPGSTLYGANAFTGVVSITTVSDRPAHGGDAYLSGGEQGHRRLFGRVRGSWRLGEGTLDYSAGLGTYGRNSPSDRRDDILDLVLRSHGYLRFRQGRKLDVSVHGGVVGGDGSVFILSGDFHGSSVVNHYTMGKAAIGLGDSLDLKAQIYHVRFFSEFHCRNRFESRGIWMADVPDFYLDANTVDGQVQVDFQPSPKLMLIGGGNIRYTHQVSDVILPHELSELRGAAFLHAQWSALEVLQLTGGLRLDLNTRTQEALSPRVVAVFRPFRNHAFRMGYGLAFRKPAALENQWHMEIKNSPFPEIFEKLENSIGNEDLVNEKVHSFEVGWRGRFLNERLRFRVDLFYNIYQDMIYFHAKLKWDPLGFPDIPESSFQFLNEEERIHALGGEAEVIYSPGENWTFWGNAGVRRVTDEEGELVESEPALRVNLGGRWSPDLGLRVDVALHYVSSYQVPLLLPEEPFEAPDPSPLGDSLLVVGRLGYRSRLPGGLWLEAGLTVRAPIGSRFREFPGVPVQRSSYTVTVSDFAGEMIVRLVALYLRGSF
jgi:outer membrane receptor for ferrienterochelin and colicin